MDNKQAIKIIETEKKCVCRQFEKGCDRLCGKCDLVLEDKEIINAYDMAINLLQAEPCEDAISRKAVLDIIRFEDKWLTDAKSNNADTDIAFSGIKSKVTDLPPIQPKTKVGKWIPIYGNVKCSVCGNVKDSRNVGKATHYCDFCGAKMEVEE